MVENHGSYLAEVAMEALSTVGGSTGLSHADKRDLRSITGQLREKGYSLLLSARRIDDLPLLSPEDDGSREYHEARMAVEMDPFVPLSVFVPMLGYYTGSILELASWFPSPDDAEIVIIIWGGGKFRTISDLVRKSAASLMRETGLVVHDIALLRIALGRLSATVLHRAKSFLKDTYDSASLAITDGDTNYPFERVLRLCGYRNDPIETLFAYVPPDEHQALRRFATKFALDTVGDLASVSVNDAQVNALDRRDAIATLIALRAWAQVVSH